MNEDLVRYVLNYYSTLLPHSDQAALRHLQVDEHSKDFPPDYKARVLAKFTNLEAAKIWMEHGPVVFRERCVRWLLEERAEDVFLNCCEQCGGLARTPKAKQCRFCGLDWHSKDDIVS